jgi:hypothetical protein
MRWSIFMGFWKKLTENFEKTLGGEDAGFRGMGKRQID